MTSHREEIKWYPVDKGYSGEGNQIRKLLSINIRFKISQGAGLRIRMEIDRIQIPDHNLEKKPDPHPPNEINPLLFTLIFDHKNCVRKVKLIQILLRKSRLRIRA